MLLLLASHVSAGTISRPSKPDPLLDGGPTAACAAGVDYAAGSDVSGNSVIPADVASRPVPLPDGVAIPFDANGAGNRSVRPGRRQASPTAPGSEGAYVMLDGKKLEPLLNPPPCPAYH